MLLGMRKQFEPLVLDGSKQHSIRNKRKPPRKRPEPGDICNIYGDSRQKTPGCLGFTGDLIHWDYAHPVKVWPIKRSRARFPHRNDARGEPKPRRSTTVSRAQIKALKGAR
jgi:hypothetical protein